VEEEGLAEGAEMYELSDQDVAWCRFQAEIEVGLWEPEIIEVEDTYTQWEVNHHPWPCDFVQLIELGRWQVEWVHGYRYKGCRPKTRIEVRWHDTRR
jgi:hypothetical protein